MIGLLLLKHMFGLSDEGVCERWVYDPYFQHTFPHERSDLSHWRRRLGDRPDLLLARRHTVRLWQSYLRVAKRAAMMAGRYAHARQFNRHHREVRFLRIRLGRLIRDIRRKIAGNEPVEARILAWLRIFLCLILAALATPPKRQPALNPAS